MINFPTIFSQRSPADNNRTKRKSSVKATKESAEVAAEKHVATAERRQDPAHRGHQSEYDRQRVRERHRAIQDSPRGAKHIDIEV